MIYNISKEDSVNKNIHISFANATTKTENELFFQPLRIRVKFGLKTLCFGWGAKIELKGGYLGNG